jgi:hypothetical protein
MVSVTDPHGRILGFLDRHSWKLLMKTEPAVILEISP